MVAQLNHIDGMVAQLNHIIVWSSDQTTSARFLAEMLGRPAPARFGPFDVVELDNGVMQTPTINVRIRGRSALG
jgi:hypothetical protein